MAICNRALYAAEIQFVVNMVHFLHQQSSDFYLNKYLMSTYVPVMLSTESLREH